MGQNFVPLNVLSCRCFVPQTFCPCRRFVPQTFCPVDLLSLQTFCPVDLLSRRRFVCRRFVCRRFVPVPKSLIQICRKIFLNSQHAVVAKLLPQLILLSVFITIFFLFLRMFPWQPMALIYNDGLGKCAYRDRDMRFDWPEMI